MTQKDLSYLTSRISRNVHVSLKNAANRRGESLEHLVERIVRDWLAEQGELETIPFKTGTRGDSG